MSQAALNEKLAERKDSVFFLFFCGILRVKPLQGFLGLEMTTEMDGLIKTTT